MKNFAFLILFIFSSTLFALPVGNPSEPNMFNSRANGFCRPQSCFDNFGVGFGFSGDYVFNRHLEVVEGKQVDRVKMFTNAAYLVLNFFDRIDVFSTLGATRLSLNTSFGAFNPADAPPLFELETATAFSYSIGAKAIVYQCGRWTFGAVGQYFSTKPYIFRMYIAAGDPTYPGSQFQTHYDEWQVAAGASWRYNDFFVPYAAVRYARAFWKLRNGQRVPTASNHLFLNNMESVKNWGYAVGLTLSPILAEKMFVSLEARFPDEKALYINAQMRF